MTTDNHSSSSAEECDNYGCFDIEQHLVALCQCLCHSCYEMMSHHKSWFAVCSIGSVFGALVFAAYTIEQCMARYAVVGQHLQ
jgi:hypothetical protein